MGGEDIDAIVGMLTEDITHAMPPWAAWFTGRNTLRTLYSSYPIWGERPGPGLFRIVPVSLNGELGFAEYCRETITGPFTALALTIALLDQTGTQIAGKVSFVDGSLFPLMGLAASLNDTSAHPQC